MKSWKDTRILVFADYHRHHLSPSMVLSVFQKMKKSLVHIESWKDTRILVFLRTSAAII